jgi:hypothetical protein
MVENERETQARDTPERLSATRREWIRAAGSGLLLSAGGLFLPEWLEEAQARPGAYGGTLGGRHGKNRRGRHRRRTHGNKKQKPEAKRPDGDQPRGGPGFLFDVAVSLHNGRSIPVQVQGWEAPPTSPPIYQVPSGWGWSAVPGTNGGGTPGSKEFLIVYRQLVAEKWVVVQIGTDRVIIVRNYEVALLSGKIWNKCEVRILSGGWDENGWNPRGQTLAILPSLFEGKSIAADNGTIKVTRLTDNVKDKMVRFTIDLT